MTAAETALVLIDLQHDFLVEGSSCSRRHVEAGALVDAVRWSVEIARQLGHALVWVESSSGEPEGAAGAAPVAELREIAEAAGSGSAEQVRLTKPSDSAFQQTALQAWLEARGIRRLVLAGVATNLSVAATAKAARQLGYEVTILADATAAVSLPRHLTALAELERAGCAIRRWAELARAPGAATPVTLRELGTGSALHLQRLPGIDDGTLAALTAEVDWLSMSHRGGEVPRLVATQGELLGLEEPRAEPLYRHPADDYPPVRAWTPLVQRLREQAAALVGHPFNHCLIQLYRDGHDWISAHSDKTLDVVPGSFIVNVSVGALRTMTLRRKHGDPEVSGERAPRVTQRIPLPHGSLLQMSLATNRDWLHEIRQQGAAGEVGPRISLTFRWIGTCWNPATGAVWGSGSPHLAREAAEAAAATRASWTEEARLRWELEQASRLLQLFRRENQSASFDQAEYQPGFEVVHLRHFQEHVAATRGEGAAEPGASQ